MASVCTFGLGASGLDGSTYGALRSGASGAEREAVSDSAALGVNNQHACPRPPSVSGASAGVPQVTTRSTSKVYQEPTNATAAAGEPDATAATDSEIHATLKKSTRSKPSAPPAAAKPQTLQTTFTAGAGARRRPQFESWVRELVEDFNELQLASSALVEAVAEARRLFGLPFDRSGLSGALTLAQVAPLECPGERSGDTSQVHQQTTTALYANLHCHVFNVCCHRLLPCRAVAAQAMKDARTNVDRAQARYGPARANLVVVARAAVLHSDVLAAQKGQVAAQGKKILEQCKTLVEEDKTRRVRPADWDLCM